jgi:hypothetical protein
MVRRSKAIEVSNGVPGSVVPDESSSTGDSATTAGRSSRNMRTLTLTALLGIFILAALLAVARHFLPRAIRRAADRRTGRRDDG